MLRGLKGRTRASRPSPAIVVAIVALVAALAGTAVAEGATTSAKPVTKKKAKKIARKQINKLAPGLSVANAENATNAENAATADKANNVYGVMFDETGPGAPSIIRATDPGITSAGCFFVCAVAFPRDVSECTYTASAVEKNGVLPLNPVMADAGLSGSDPTTVIVGMWDDTGSITAQDFAMTVVCP
jgi:hypothetical protein